MNKENQLYQLIPEPAGDWQEGDILISIGADPEYHRLRPVKAQSGQLWSITESSGVTQVHTKTHWVGETMDPKTATVFKELVSLHNASLRPVPAQACACEGLRKIAEEAESQLRADGYIYLPDKLRKALAQSCQHSVQQPDLNGGDLGPRGFKSKTSVPASAPPAQNISEKGGPANLSREERHWRQREAQNISERGDASCREQQNNENTEFGTTSASNAAPESFDPTRVAAEDVPNQILEIDEDGKVHDRGIQPPAAASEAQIPQVVPSEITSAAHKVSDWAMMNGFTDWEIGPVASRKTVAALRLELAEANKAKHRAGQLWPKLIQAEDDRDQWKKRALKAEALDYWGPTSQPEVWHDYATDPPKEEDGVVRSYGYAWIWLSLPSGGLRLVHWSHVPVLPGCKWARITWPAVPAKPVQDKEEEKWENVKKFVEPAANQVFKKCGTSSFDSTNLAAAFHMAVTTAEKACYAALSHARATEEK